MLLFLIFNLFWKNIKFVIEIQDILICIINIVIFMIINVIEIKNIIICIKNIIIIIIIILLDLVAGPKANGSCFKTQYPWAASWSNALGSAARPKAIRSCIRT